MSALLAFALTAGLFLSRPSCFWNFDGVACAAALELGNPLFFFHSNHLLYGFFGWGFWKALIAVAGPLRALPALQIFTSLLSAGAMAGIFRSLQHLKKDPFLNLGVVTAIAATPVVWMWSSEAQVYPLGLLGLAWATEALLNPAYEKSKAVRAGLWHSLAVMGHVAHLLWILPAVYWLWTSSRTSLERKRSIGQYAAALLLPLIIAYGLVLLMVVLPSPHPWAKPGVWLLGSAGLTPTRDFEWHSEGWKGPLLWLKTTARFFWGSLWPYDPAPPGLGTWGMTAFSIGSLLTLTVAGWRTLPLRLRMFCLAWIIPYALFFWSWEPSTECYRLSDAVPWALIIGAGALLWPDRMRARIMLLVFLLSTATLTFITRTLPLSKPELNRDYMEVRKLAARTAPDSRYVVPGGRTWIYLLYFTGRQAWNRDSPEGRKLLRPSHE